MAGGRPGSGGGREREDERRAEQPHMPQPSAHDALPSPTGPDTQEVATDPPALSELVAGLHGRLMGSLLARRGVDRETAQDACQHAYLVFVEKRPEVESVEHAFRWLNITAHRQVNKWQRRQRRITDQEVPEQSIPDVVETMEGHFLLEAVVAAFHQLSPLYREALRIAAEERDRGASRRERDRISLQVHRARKRLRDRLEDWWVVLPWTRWRSAEGPAAWSPGVAVQLLAACVIGSVVLGADGSSRSSDSTAVVRNASSQASRTRTEPPLPAATAADAVVGVTRRSRQQAGAPPRAQPGLSATGPLDNHRVAVDSPATPYGPIEVGTAPRPPKDNSLLCWGNWIVVPDGCIVHPLRS